MSPPLDSSELREGLAFSSHHLINQKATSPRVQVQRILSPEVMSSMVLHQGQDDVSKEDLTKLWL